MYSRLRSYLRNKINKGYNWIFLHSLEKDGFFPDEVIEDDIVECIVVNGICGFCGAGLNNLDVLVTARELENVIDNGVYNGECEECGREQVFDRETIQFVVRFDRSKLRS